MKRLLIAALLFSAIVCARAQTVVVMTNNVFSLSTVPVSASAGYFLLRVEARQADGAAVVIGSATSVLTLVDSVFAQPIATVYGTAASSTNCILSFFVPNLLAGTFTASAVVSPPDSPAYAVALLQITATAGSGSGAGSQSPLTNTVNGAGNTISNATFYGNGAGLTNLVLTGAVTNLGATVNGSPITNGAAITVSGGTTQTTWAVTFERLAGWRSGSNNVGFAGGGIVGDALTTQSGAALTNYDFQLFTTWTSRLSRTVEWSAIVPVGFSTATGMTFRFAANQATGNVSAVIFSGSATNLQTVNCTAASAVKTGNFALGALGLREGARVNGSFSATDLFSTNAANSYQLFGASGEWQK